MEQQGEIILYQPDESVRMEVRIEDETVWLTQAQIAELFETKRQAITKHLKNIFQSGELNENSVCSILELTASDGKSYKTKTYNLDAIISVGYRVNSKKCHFVPPLGKPSFKRLFIKRSCHQPTHQQP
jgi:Virulence protein